PVENDILARRHGALGRGETNLAGRLVQHAQLTMLVFLAIAHLGHASHHFTRRLAGDPGELTRAQRTTHQRRVLAALHHNEHVALEILARHEPRFAGRVLAPADAQPLALPERVVHQAPMATDSTAVERLDVARLSGQIPGQELRERSLSDEADSGAALLVADRQQHLAGAASQIFLAHRATGDMSARERWRGCGGQAARPRTCRVDATAPAAA